MRNEPLYEDALAAPAVWPRISLRIRNAHLVKAGLLGFLAPLLIFALHLQPLAAASLVAAFLCAAYLIVFNWTPGAVLSAQADGRLFAGCLATGFALCLLGGESHIFFSTWDWVLRDAVLSDVVSNKYPVFYHYLGEDVVLRAPLGMYMAPAGLGWILGLKAAHYALLVQNSLLFATIFYLVSLLAEGARRQFLGLLILFGPLDVIPNLIEAYFYDYRSTGVFTLQPHFMQWNTLIQFWAHLPQIFWAPNHALAAWMAATMILLHIRREIDLVLLAIGSFILLFWSPLGLLGAAPLYVWRGFGGLNADLLTRRTAIALVAAICFAPLFAYLTIDSGSLSHGWLTSRTDFLLWYVAAMVFGLPQAWILLWRRETTPTWLRPVLYLSIALLVLMPTYRLGATELDNDMAMRCLMAPLFILAFAFCQAAPKLVEASGAKAFVTTAVIMLSAMTGLMEIRRAVVDPAYEINDCNLSTVLGKVFQGYPAANYLAHVDQAPAWLLRADGRRLDAENRQCWPGYPLARGLHDVPEPDSLKGAQ